MKFAHLADCHIGSFRDYKLKNLNMRAFRRAINLVLEKNVDFVLISGDLFNTAIPSIDLLKDTVKVLKKLKLKEIPLYVISGSHDYSPSGKTIIDVLEEADLLVNVVKGSVENNTLKLKFTMDKKTNAKITGILGKKGMLDKKYYADLERNSLENETGFKIFMFHTSLSEFKPQEMKHIDSLSISNLPKNFNYYAGGHLHKYIKQEYSNAPLIYPGPTFPVNFREIEKLKQGSFVIYDNGNIEKINLNLVNVFSVNLNCNNKNPVQIETELKQEIRNREFINTIVTIRLKGVLQSGTPTDINWTEIYSLFEKKQAFYVMRNTEKLLSKEFSEIKVDMKSTEEVEEKLIDEHKGKLDSENLDDEKETIKKLMHSLSIEKQEGETNTDFERRLVDEVKKIMNL